MDIIPHLFAVVIAILLIGIWQYMNKSILNIHIDTKNRLSVLEHHLRIVNDQLHQLASRTTYHRHPDMPHDQMLKNEEGECIIIVGYRILDMSISYHVVEYMETENGRDRVYQYDNVCFMELDELPKYKYASPNELYVIGTLGKR